MSAVAKDLIQRLLMKDPKKRLGWGPRDADEIREHPFFQVKHTERVASEPPFPGPWAFLVRRVAAGISGSFSLCFRVSSLFKMTEPFKKD